MAVRNIFAEMCAGSLVRDIGPALPEYGFIKYRANPELHRRNLDELLDCVRDFMTAVGLPAVVSIDDINAYYQAMVRNRAFGIHGTTPGNGTLWLFLIAKALNPSLIIESGVYQGSSLFTLRSAAPLARIIAFDISFTNLLERLEGVDYRERDWGNDAVQAQGLSDLCFFDDHTNNCRRVRQSYQRGFRHVIVDDSPDLGEIHEFRIPGVPTISMIENGKWMDGDTVEWNWQGRRLHYTFRVADTFGVKEVIESAHRFPSLKRWTGMDDAFHYYLRLKPSK